MAAAAVARPSAIPTSQQPAITSCASLLAFLDEDDVNLRHFALQRLNVVVNDFWAEIADHIEKIEELFEDTQFPHRKLAALLASQVHYHLEEFAESLLYALGAEELFDVSCSTEYVDTIISVCIDEYISQRAKSVDEPEDSTVTVDSRLEGIVERMFDRCFQEKQWRHIIGVSLEARRLDKVEAAITASGEKAVLTYTFETCQTLVTNRAFRTRVLRLLVEMHSRPANPDHLQICLCLMLLDDASRTAEVLDKLIKSGSKEDELMAYQIAFDLSMSEIQHFLLNVRNALPAVEDATDAADPNGADKAAPAETPEQKRYKSCSRKLRHILSGAFTISLHTDFLSRNVHSDMLIIKNIKGALDARNSVTHEATVFANAVMHCGTRVDAFLRDNLDWLKRATNWAKFSATASIGMIFKGCVGNSLEVMKQYLPQPGGGMSPYSDGGAYYALGIIHANHGEGIIPYLQNALQGCTNEIIQHGGCLGLGLAGMATENPEIFDTLKTVLYQDNAVAGEAAGIAMGLVQLGTLSPDAVDAMLSYAHETQHEKIIRGLALGLSLLVYQKEEGADSLIEQLTRDKDPILRYGGMYAIAMAYCNTASNSAIRRLLHVAVSDVSDDVRRAAVTALGFVLTNIPEQCPRVVSLLSESYNPHVRYGATLAVGISCAGTGLKEAIDLLEPMTSDAVDFVRQGALISIAMVLCQQTEVRDPKVGTIRKLFDKIINDKHEDVMAKFGAILGQGILDAGGRNVTISLRTNTGQARMSGVVGMAVFTQCWYWYPLMHFLSLTFTPTCLIGLNSDLQMPKFDIVSNTAPSRFAYPPATKVEETKKAEKVATAILSTTARTKAREQEKAKEKEKKEGVTAMDTDEAKAGDKNEGTDGKADGTEEGKEKEEEPTTTTLHNPARVLPAQEQFIVFPEGRYRPVKKVECGIILLTDTRPEDKTELIVLDDGTEEEVPVPEPFEYTE